MAPSKRKLLSDDVTATVDRPIKKVTSRKATTDDSENGITRRGSRSKNFKVPNVTASARGTVSAKVQGKNLSKMIPILEQFVPMQEPNDSNHERVIFIDNDTAEPKFALYRKTEKAEPMAGLWAQFLQGCQTARDHIGASDIGSFLSQQEMDAIKLKENTNIFPELITSKGALRSKDNLQASTNKAQRSLGSTFSQDAAAATATSADQLRSRASSLRKKAQALNRQADAYAKVADTLDEDEPLPEETELAKKGMSYLGDVLTYSRKEFNRYINDHEDHLTATAEKLRSDMVGLAAFVNRAEKRLRDLIQLKVAADYKLCRDLKDFGKFEMKAWQMGALPIGAHVCWCDQCVGIPEDDGAAINSTRVPLRYPTGQLPQRRPEDALPDISLDLEENDENDNNDGGLAHLLAQTRRQRQRVTATGVPTPPVTATTTSTDNDVIQAAASGAAASDSSTDNDDIEAAASGDSTVQATTQPVFFPAVNVINEASRTTGVIGNDDIEAAAASGYSTVQAKKNPFSFHLGGLPYPL